MNKADAVHLLIFFNHLSTYLSREQVKLMTDKMVKSLNIDGKLLVSYLAAIFVSCYGPTLPPVGRHHRQNDLIPNEVCEKVLSF